MRRWTPWHAVIAVVSAALGYVLSWLAGDEPMDALVNAALAGLIGFLIVEYLHLCKGVERGDPPDSAHAPGSRRNVVCAR